MVYGRFCQLRDYLQAYAAVVFSLLEKYWNAPLPDYKNTNYLLSVQYFCLLLCGVCDKGHTKVGT